MMKSLFILLMLTTCTVGLTAKEIGPEVSLKTEIKSMLQGIELPDDNVIEADVKFLVNDENQIVVVSIETDEAFLERVIKARLNYKEVQSNEAKPNKINKVKLILKAT